MKNKEFWGLMFNPFIKIAGWEALGLGLAINIIAAFIGVYSRTVFDGAFDVHLVAGTNFISSFAYLGIGLLSLIFTLTIMAFVISRNFRIVDVVGTILLARAPLILVSLAGFLTHAPDAKVIMANPAVLFTSVSFIVVMILIVPVALWSIALQYNAIKVSCGVKGSKLIAGCIIALFAAEVLSKIIIFYFIK
ncbi:MAG: hypothetical protein Q8910_14510 [Bacteroidota bacterium]|nr:hypothetical protein [Bacteroidota bacterium]MDP4227583.1 hypothetical protein [Bacteroidota bacterium]